MMSIRLALAIGVALFITGGRAEASDRQPLSTLTIVGGGAVEANGTLWFSGWTDGISFFVPPNDGIDAQRLFATLKASAETGRALAVTFDPASGRFDGYHGRIAYRICTVVAGTERFGSSDGKCGVTAASFGLAIPAPLALGVADSATNRSESVAELDIALRDTTLAPALRVIALRARSNAHNFAALRNSTLADTHLVAALHDATAWAAVTPEDREAWLEAAGILTDLGAYDDAIRSYRAIAAHWVEENYRAAVRIGTIYRTQGRYQDALAELDGLVARQGPQPGMKFHYHRGVTLTLLARYDEAIREFTAGLESQPDYAWAHLRRACAYAADGQIDKAAADQRIGVEEFSTALSSETEPLASARADLVYATTIAKQFDALAAKKSTSPFMSVCDGYSDDRPKRTQSPLLKRADIAAAIGNWSAPSLN